MDTEHTKPDDPQNTHEYAVTLAERYMDGAYEAFIAQARQAIGEGTVSLYRMSQITDWRYNKLRRHIEQAEQSEQSEQGE